MDWHDVTSFAVQLDPATNQAGYFDYFSQGQGLFRSQQAATISSGGNGSLHIQYSGSAWLDVNAHIDQEYGVVTPSGQDPQAVTVTLDAHIQDDHTATAQLWMGNGQPIHVVSTSAPQNAGSTAARIMAAVATQDWGSLYGYAYTPLQQTLTPSEFATWITSALSGRGSIVTAQVTGPVTLVTGASGITSSTVPVSLTLSLNGTQTTYSGTLKLLFEHDSSWRFITIDSGS